MVVRDGCALLTCTLQVPNGCSWPRSLQDLLCWRGYALYDCTAEFRTFWLQTKFAEEGLAVEDTAAPNQQTGAASWEVDKPSTTYAMQLASVSD